MTINVRDSFNQRIIFPIKYKIKAENQPFFYF